MSWIEVAAPGSPAPDDPAPVLSLSASIGSSPASVTPTTVAGHAIGQAGVSQGEVTVAIALGALALVLAGAALALPVANRLRRGTSGR